MSHGSYSRVSWWVTVTLCLCWNKCLTIGTLHSVEYSAWNCIMHFAMQNIFAGVSSVHKFLRIGYGVLHLYLSGFGCHWYGIVKGNISWSHLNISKGGSGSVSSRSGENDVHSGSSGWRRRFLVLSNEEKTILSLTYFCLTSFARGEFGVWRLFSECLFF